MKSITEAHVARPGLAVVEVAALDDATVFAVQELLAAQCAIAAAERTVHEPGEPGVRLRLFLDLHPDDDEDNAVSGSAPAGTALTDTGPAAGRPPR
ncbi:DUF6207 family protein [Streptomyces sp. enrichment culture]|uniref:DUF6207 family protein n=1 Tax=Streptomyces sp. enrichment culture TaxID=1795815 RepID=UPI003F546A12